MTNIKLRPEMIPRTSFFVNLRSILSTAEWDLVRRDCYQRAGYRCEICNGKGSKHPVECHEVWDYNEQTGIQKLIRLIALCPSCHEVVHIGLAGIRGRTDHAVAHLQKVNNIDSDTAQHIVQEAWELWERRNKINWTLDVSAVQLTKGKAV